MKNIFFKLMNNAVFGKATENMKKKLEILKLSGQKEEEPIWCHNQIMILIKFFPENVLAMEMKKTRDTY